MSDEGAIPPEEVKRSWELAADKRRATGARLGLPEVLNGPGWTPLVFLVLGGSWMLYRTTQVQSGPLRLLAAGGAVVFILCMVWATIARRRRR